MGATAPEVSVTPWDFLRDVFCGSNLENRDGLEAVTGVPGHVRAPPS